MNWCPQCDAWYDPSNPDDDNCPNVGGPRHQVDLDEQTDAWIDHLIREWAETHGPEGQDVCLSWASEGH